MKKTVLSIALFSLIAVSTSFASADNSKMISESKISVDPNKTGSGSVGGGRKLDLMDTQDQTTLNTGKLNFSDINQSTSRNYKVD